MTQPAPTTFQSPWNTPQVAPESARQFRDAFGGRSRQWEYRKSDSDPDFPKPDLYRAPKISTGDRLEYVRILKLRSDAKLAAKAAAKVARELADGIITAND